MCAKVSFAGIALMRIACGAVGDEKTLNPVVISHDLNGDGVIEEIRFEPIEAAGQMGYHEFAIVVNGARSVYGGEYLTGEFHVVDIDSTDGLVELAASEYGPSDDPAVYFFRYPKHELIALGRLPGHLDSSWAGIAIDGSGMIVAHCRGRLLHTWWYACKYEVGQSGEFERVQEAAYPMDAKLTVRQELPLVSDVAGDEIVVVLRPGNLITVLSSDDVSWCLAESEDGVQGWFELASPMRLADGRSVHEVFEGLRIAD